MKGEKPLRKAAHGDGSGIDRGVENLKIHTAVISILTRALKELRVATDVAPIDAGPRLSYIVHMSTTITIRADEPLRESLDKKAAASGKTVSELVREILEFALAETPLQFRAGHLKGRLRLPRTTSEPWRKRLRLRNWRT